MERTSNHTVLAKSSASIYPSQRAIHPTSSWRISTLVMSFTNTLTDPYNTFRSTRSRRDSFSFHLSIATRYITHWF